MAKRIDINNSKAKSADNLRKAAEEIKAKAARKEKVEKENAEFRRAAREMFKKHGS